MRTVRRFGKSHVLAAAFGSFLMVATAAGGVASASAARGASTIKVPAKYSSGLSMAMDATYPPDEYTPNGNKIVGFDADLGYAIGKVLGVKVTLENVKFEDIILGVTGGKYAVGNSSFTDTKAREKQVDFIDYFKAGEGFYERAASSKTYNGLKSLCGHSVAVETGTTEASDADAQAKLCKVTVDSYGDQNDVNVAVSTGRADLGFADSQVAAWIVNSSHGAFKLTGTPFKTAPYGFIVAKGSGLTQPLLAAVTKLMADGQYMKILVKWGVQQGAVPKAQLNGATS